MDESLLDNWFFESNQVKITWDTEGKFVAFQFYQNGKEIARTSLPPDVFRNFRLEVERLGQILPNNP